MGINNFLKLRKLTKTKTVPLGGINNNNLKQLSIHGIDSFASIRLIENIYE